MRRVLFVAAASLLLSTARSPHAQSAAALPDIGQARTIEEADCTGDKLGTTIPVGAIGEPVSGVSLAAPTWTAATESTPAYCSIDGALAPVTADAKPINFRVVFPSAWTLRAAHIGGGGMNGNIPGLTGGRGGGAGPAQGFVTFGSDSGHRTSDPPQWSLSDEAIKNLGYMQMKKTRDAAMVLVERMYGQRPKVSYYIGTSQGGREALTVAQRYPDDYDGVIANVPIVHFSTLMLAPELIRIQERPLANWVTRAKVEAIRSEFLRQCDRLDGFVDGIINNYVACRAIFDVRQPPAGRRPWAAKRCANNVDPDPANASADACLTDGQIATLEFVYSRYRFASALVNGVTTFGMWLPNIDPSGSGLIADVRFRGQEGATAESPTHRHLGVLGVTGFLMKNPDANPLDYVEGGSLEARRRELSEWLDSTNPDLSRFARRGGKIIVTVGTDDTLASPGAQLDYYQAVIDRMGRQQVDAFARFFVMPQAGHGLSGRNHSVDGEGKTIPVSPIPNAFDRVRLLADWVERTIAPGRAVVVSAGGRTLPLCSYPAHPHYLDGPPTAATSYECR
jgi:pimeloyl-ACP methyl ester carboxylesterase